MKTLTMFLIVLLIAVSFQSVLGGDKIGNAPQWKESLGEKIVDYHFLQDGKYIFFTNGKWMWCYDAKTGANRYKMEVKDFKKEGIQTLIANNTRYLVASGDKVQCYDPAEGKLLWEQKYKDINQGDYTEEWWVGNSVMLRYGDKHVGIDLATGAEKWRTKIEYKGELALKGTYNFFHLDQQAKFLVMEDGNKVALYSMTDGQKIFEAKDFEANMSLVEHANTWYYKSDDHKFMLFVLDDGAAVVDVVNNKILVRHKFSIDGDKQVIIPTNPGCAVLGKEQIVHFNFSTGQVSDIKFPLGDVRTFHSYEVAGKDLLVFGLDSKMAVVDIVEGKLLWESKKDDKNFEGYAHEYESSSDGKTIVDGKNITFSYNNPNMSGDEKGTNLYLMSIDAFSGKVNFRIKVALCDFAMSSFTRGLAKTLTSAMTGFMSVASAGMAAPGASAAQASVNASLGWTNIGFTYEMMPFNGNIMVYIHTTARMQNPDTRKDGGEGFCLVNAQTGKIVYKDYFEICDDNAHVIQPPAAHSSMVVEKNIAYIAGKNRIIAFDLAEGKRVWTIEKELKESYPVDLAVIDGVLYCKLGKIEFAPVLDKDDIKINEGWKKEPYGFAAIEPSNGKILWRVDTKSDPGFSTPYFSIEKYYSPTTRQLYFADEENVYALKLGRDGGKFDWTYNLENNKVGKIKYKDSYAVNKTWLGAEHKVSKTDYYFNGSFAYSVKMETGGMSAGGQAEFMDDAMNAELSTSYESWGNYWGVSANHCLRVLFNGNRIIAFGPEGIGYIDPASGKGEWVHKWEYDKGEVQLLPQVIGGRLVYCVKRKMTLVDLSKGSVVWQNEEAKKPGFFFSPDREYVFSIDDEDIAGYEMK